MKTTKAKTGIRVPDERKKQIVDAARALAKQRSRERFSQVEIDACMADLYIEDFEAGARFALARVEEEAAR